MYTIGEVSKKMDISPSTLRYYDKEGLLPFVERNKSGDRRFKDSDLEWLVLIECLKSTGLSIKGIRQYIDWYMEGDETLKLRYEMFLERREETLRQIENLQNMLKIIDHKCHYYETAIQAGTEKIHHTNDDYSSNQNVVS
ncbi:MerR family transcriptional regulator [Anaerostipes sp. MSJ-23]|uniref:MerR family transcriptional regulator n=1 Tax=unclassified Anaerostipes TaxID=2635253 RepID=UPI001C11468A|nr:MerR family transcriptional regulator [Anaerostipes sp. MSJ-23]MBU5460103.1 MerR family transcriptional regulator [Anaerostipes sp. MSJ-23]